MICAGLRRGGKDSCRGDSGGPLIKVRFGKAYLIGIVSYGGHGMCARENSGAVYTKVSHYTNWIKSNIDQIFAIILALEIKESTQFPQSKFEKLANVALKRVRRHCRPLWFNYCLAHYECCSQNCFKEPHWRYGVCRPTVERINKCKPLWYNMCIVHDDCCTRNCERQEAYWKYGVCGPSEEMLGRNKGCKPVGFQFCKLNSDCCSKNCFRKPEWAYGKCQRSMPVETEDLKLGNLISSTLSEEEEMMTEETSEKEMETTTKRMEVEVCGKSDVITLEPRIIGGRNATRGEFPWQVSLRASDFNNKIVHMCGAAIISKRYVITAAHCVEDYQESDLTVVAGSFSLNDATIGETKHKVEKIMKHQHYKPKVYLNDIALLKLSNPIRYDRTKQPICLPQKSDVVPKVLTVSGWGKTQEHGFDASVLQTVNIKVVKLEKCKMLLKEA
ncbi:coagulation factor VII-like protein, partial [Dinothrombium tinctorium]